MLESFTTDKFEYKKLSQEEQQKRGILGRLVGLISHGGKETRNGRKYSSKLWENVFNDPIMKERIKNNCCFGELGHPADREETDMEKICWVMDGEPKRKSDGGLYAVFNILDTPNGRILKTLCDYGCRIGASSRGSGEVNKGFDGTEEVDPDSYDCQGWDAVIIPALEDARLTYVTESLDKKKYNKTLRQKLSESIEKASEDDKKVMKEALNTLGVNLYSDSAEVLEKTVNEIIDTLKEDGAYFDSEFWTSSNSLDKVIGSWEELKDYYNTLSHEHADEISISSGLRNILEDSGSRYEKLLDILNYAELFFAINYDMATAAEYSYKAKPGEEAYPNIEEFEDELDGVYKDFYFGVYDEDGNLQKVVLGKDYLKEGLEEEMSKDKLFDEFLKREFFIYCGDKLVGTCYGKDLIKDNEIIIEDEDSESAVDNNEAFVEELQKALKSKSELETKVIELQEKLSVCYAKESLKEEQIDKYKKSIQSLTESNKKISALTEKLNRSNEDVKASKQKEQEYERRIKSLESLLKTSKEKKTSLKESVISKNEEITSLTTKVASLKNEVSSLKEELSSLSSDNDTKQKEYANKLSQSNQLVEKYKGIARSAVNKYIESQAVRLGVKPEEIKNRLPESYNFKDIDAVCEDLKKYKVSIGRLPFTSSLKEDIKMTVKPSTNDHLMISDSDDEVDSQLMSLARLQ